MAAQLAADTKSNFGGRGWSIIVFQALMFWFSAGITTHGLNVVLPTLTGTYGLDNTRLLAWATPASWAGVVAGFLCAKMADKWGAKFTILISLVLASLAWGLLGLSSTVAAFVICFAAVQFFGTGFGYIGGPTLMANWFPLKKDLALGWTTMGQAFSSAFFVPVLAFFLATFGPVYGFSGMSVMMMVLFVLIAAFVKNKPEELGCYPDNDPHSTEKLAALHAQEGPVPELTTGRLLRNKDVWLIGLGSGCVYIVLVGIISQIVPRLMALGYDLNTAVLYMMISALVGVPGAFFWGWLGQAMSTRLALVVYMAWWFVAVVLNMFELNPVILWASLLMIGFSLGGATNLTTSIVASKFRRELFVKAFGIIHPIQSVVRCFAFSILAFGLAYLGGYTGAYALLAGVCLLTMILFWNADTTPIV
ncbi:MFS transporter [Consotaella aegiceratis]|uniref:MFS transporter n=1 Tax=Consotaella aegiceratis TaxID=3097961 RepID=UPI002F40FCBD